MENLLKPFITLLDTLYFGIISPIFSFLSRGLEFVLLEPLRIIQLPPALQVVVVAFFAAALSISIRKLIKVEEKEATFKAQFTAKKAKQEDLHLISDWKSREKFAKAIDDDIDEDFNTYLAGRFSRYGMAYLLPIFMTLFWLDGIITDTFLIALPESTGYQGISTQIVFLFAYCTALFIYFKRRKKRLKKVETQDIANPAQSSYS
jgi:Flp pilus assembly protein TadB